MHELMQLYNFGLICTKYLYIADVQDGEVWRSSRILQKTWNLGLGMNADGIPVYKSGYNFFPVFMSFLNLPPSTRYSVENIFLCCLHPGPKEPTNTNEFFKPLIAELRKLYLYGMHDF